MEPYQSIFSIMDLPQDSILEIFSNSNFSDFGIYAQVHTQWKEALKECFNQKRIALEADILFGTKNWKLLLNYDISKEEEEEAFNSIPLNIDEIPCPIDPEKKMIDTHVFTYFPKDLTLRIYGELLKQKFPDNLRGFRIISDKILKDHGDIPIKSGWKAMTKEVIPDSLNRFSSLQKQMAGSFDKHRIPSALEAIVCISTEYFKTGDKIFNSYFTCCQEGIGKRNLCANASSKGFNILWRKQVYQTNHVGVAVLRDY